MGLSNLPTFSQLEDQKAGLKQASATLDPMLLLYFIKMPEARNLRVMRHLEIT